MPTVVNKSTVCSDDEVRRWVAACDRQMKEHFAPAHELKPWTLTFEKPAYISIYVVDDDRSVPDALAWHEYDGRPVGVVLAKTALDYGEHPSVSLSHEYLETRLDPFCNDLGDGFWKEVCDPVQASAYQIDGVHVSNFVSKYWWTQNSPGPWDHLRHLSGPQEIERGGYIVRYDLSGGLTIHGRKPMYHGWRSLSR